MRLQITKKRICITDIILCAVLCLSSFLIPFVLRALSGDGSLVKITYEGKTETYPISTDRTVEVSSNGELLTVIIEDSSVRVDDASCPDRICEKTGRISSSGSSIICAAAKVCITVSGESEADYEFR